MEIERNKNGSKVSSLRTNSQNLDRMDKAKAISVEVPSIRLSPEQIEEIHVDEYSLTLFYATRVEPLTLNDIKREFPEPEPKKAQSVLDRFLKVGLVQIKEGGAYYSNYPENYINYSHYRYDGDLEARKDSKVFHLMKENTGKLEYWKDRTYFSMDAFFSKEQSEELHQMFKAIKLKAKDFANENAKKKSIRGLRFRRLKFFDMFFSMALMLFLALGVSSKSYARGNDPVTAMFATHSDAAIDFLVRAKSGGGGNDPTAAIVMGTGRVYLASASGSEGPGNSGGGHDPTTGVDIDPTGGGGHDPAEPPKPGATSGGCYLELNGQVVEVKSSRVCKLKKLIDFLNSCGESNRPVCIEAERRVDILIQRIEAESRTE